MRSRISRIVPLVRFMRTRPSGVWVRATYPKGKLFFICSPHDASDISFLWVAERGRRMRGMKQFAKILTEHTPNWYGLFAPTIAEIHAQIPECWINKVVAFEILPLPSPLIHESGLFEAEVILYQTSKNK